MSKVHIAGIDFPTFYAEVFPSLEEARAFYLQLNELPPEKSSAQTVFHQAARMVWLADKIDMVARARPAFQVLFYLIAAELVAKLVFNFRGRGKVKGHVLRFFMEICDEETRVRLGNSFKTTTYGAVSAEGVVTLLYYLRCDVAHEGMYYRFHLQDELDDGVPQMTHVGDADYITTMTLQELRRMVLKGAVSASRRLLEEAKQSAAPTSRQPLGAKAKIV